MASSLCKLLLLFVSCSICPALVFGRSVHSSQEVVQVSSEPDPDTTDAAGSFVLGATTSVTLQDQSHSLSSVVAKNDEKFFISNRVKKPSTSSDSIASILEENGLPVGLLPSSVDSYDVTEDGQFSVSLSKECYVDFDYEVYYAKTVTGTLSYGAISNLAGIQVKKAFIWLSVTGIHIDDSSSSYIYFDVGPISKKLSISQFETVPVCKAKATDLRKLARLDFEVPFDVLSFITPALATAEAIQSSDTPNPNSFHSFEAQREPSSEHDQDSPLPKRSVNLDIASLLKQNGLPIGLFPLAVENYTLSDDGRFSLSLPEACLVDFDYEAYFARTITGRLSYHAISDLSGIKANDGFAWHSVTGIRHDDSSVCYIYFDFGSSSKKVSLWQFQSVPACNAKDVSLRSCEETCEKTGCLNDRCFPRCKVSVNGGSPEVLQGKCPYDAWIEWDCADECRFQCMMLQETKRINDGQPPVKYNGKWPFKRSLGFQEPMSVMFSIANIAVHLQGLISLYYLLHFVLPKRPQGKKGPYYEYGPVWTAYGLAALNSWMWSAVFHARNSLVREKIDHSAGVALYGVGLTVAIIRSLNLRIEATQVMVAAPVMAFVSTHILYLNFYNYHYGWNARVAAIIEALQLLLWAVWAGFMHHPSRMKLWSVVAFTVLSKVIDNLDIPPLWGLLDGHALWIGFNVLFTWLWWTFIKEDASHRTFQLLRRSQETGESKKSQ